MGCGESKHNVATDNTITRKKSNAGGQSKKSKDIENVLETGTKDQETDSSAVQQQEGDHQNVNNNVGGGDHPVAEVRDITENLALKEGDHKEKQGSGGVAEEHEPTGRLISNESPSQYFSSRKGEEAVDGIVSKQKSEKSDDNSPRLEGRKESLFNDNEKLNNAVEATSMVEQTAEETKNEEGASVKEEKSSSTDICVAEGASVKEEKPSSTDICIAEGASVKEEKAAQQAEVSTPPTTTATITVEKNQNAEKE